MMAEAESSHEESPSTCSEPSADAPLVWAILCGRAGDNGQIIALACALGWRVEVKRLVYHRNGRLLDVWRGTTLAGIDQKKSSPLGAPWPDVIISASMQNEPVCRWIVEQSGGRTKYVHLGKPWAKMASFDLVITVPEYKWIADRPNILRNVCSLHDVNQAKLSEKAERWAPDVAHLPKPHVSLLVGGYAGPYAFDRVDAERLGREASELVRGQGGALLVTTSARTSRAVVETLVASLDVPFTLHEWNSEADENPYIGFLGLADSIIVTSDSTSMLAEACATQKPVYMFDLAGPRGGQPKAAIWRRLNKNRMQAFLYRNVLLRIAPKKIKRDISRVHAELIGAGRAVWLGEAFPDELPGPLDEMPRAIARVRALVGDGIFSQRKSAR